MYAADHKEHHVWMSPRNSLEWRREFGISADDMEVTMETSEIPKVLPNRIGIFHLAATGSLTAAIIFEISWLGTYMSFASPTHAYIGLFTLANIQSETALLEGSLWSFLIGGLSGGLIAAIYNMLAGLRH